MAFKVKLPTIRIGAAYKKSFLWSTQDKDGVLTPVDLVGMNGRIQLRRKAGDTAVLADWSTENGKLVFSDTNRITIHVLRSETEAFTFREAEWDLIVWPGVDFENSELIMYGTVPASRTITDIA